MQAYLCLLTTWAAISVLHSGSCHGGGIMGISAFDAQTYVQRKGVRELGLGRWT
jgi:hypothetical protein